MIQETEIELQEIRSSLDKARADLKADIHRLGETQVDQGVRIEKLEKEHIEDAVRIGDTAERLDDVILEQRGRDAIAQDSFTGLVARVGKLEAETREERSVLLSDEVETLRSYVDNVNKEVKRLAANEERLFNRVREHEEGINELKLAIGGIGDSISRNTAPIERLERMFMRRDAAEVAQADHIKDLEAFLRRLEEDVSQCRASIEEIESEALTARIKTQHSGFRTAISQLIERVERLERGRSEANVGISMVNARAAKLESTKVANNAHRLDQIEEQVEKLEQETVHLRKDFFTFGDVKILEPEPPKLSPITSEDVAKARGIIQRWKKFNIPSESLDLIDKIVEFTAESCRRMEKEAGKP